MTLCVTIGLEPTLKRYFLSKLHLQDGVQLYTYVAFDHIPHNRLTAKFYPLRSIDSAMT